MLIKISISTILDRDPPAPDFKDIKDPGHEVTDATNPKDLEEFHPQYIEPAGSRIEDLEEHTKEIHEPIIIIDEENPDNVDEEKQIEENPESEITQNSVENEEIDEVKDRLEHRRYMYNR